MGLLLLRENLCNIHKYGFVFDLIGDQPWLTLSWRLSLSYRTQSIDLHSNHWAFLYDRNIRHERVNSYPSICKLSPSKWVRHVYGLSLHEKCLNKKLFLVRIFLYLDWCSVYFLYSVQIQENADHSYMDFFHALYALDMSCILLIQLRNLEKLWTTLLLRFQRQIEKL